MLKQVADHDSHLTKQKEPTSGCLRNPLSGENSLHFTLHMKRIYSLVLQSYHLSCCKAITSSEESMASNECKN